MNIFSRIILAILLALCLQSVGFAESPSDGSERLTEQSILSFLKVQDDAFIRSDAAAWVSTLADDYTDTIYLPDQQGQPPKVMKRTRREVEATAVKFYPTYSNIQLRHEDRKINISQDGRSATVTQRNHKTLTSGGKSADVITLTTDTYELRGGKIVATIGIMKLS